MEKGLIADRGALRRLFHEVDAHGSFVIDDDGAAWLDRPDNGFVRRAGISASNIDAPGSDPWTLRLDANTSRNYRRLPERS